MNKHLQSEVCMKIYIFFRPDIGSQTVSVTETFFGFFGFSVSHRQSFSACSYSFSARSRTLFLLADSAILKSLKTPMIAELAERSPIIIQNSSNPSNRENLDVRPYDRPYKVLLLTCVVNCTSSCSVVQWSLHSTNTISLSKGG